MKKTEKIITVLVAVGLIALTIIIETRHYKQDKFYDRIDSTMVKADSALVKAHQSIKTTDSITQLIRMENQEMMDDIKYNRKLNNID
jgi:cellobiose-specific phosphotransferase system component IIA